MKNKDLKETKISSEKIFSGNMLEIRVDRVKLPDKSQAKRLYIRHPGAALVIAEIKKDHFLFVEQFRYAIGKVMLEFPSGKRDHKEKTALTAKRELLEETGFATSQIKKLGTIHPCIGYSNESIEVFYTNKLEFKKQQLDQGEFLNVLVMTKKQIELSIKNGKITDAKTLSAWTLFKS